MGRVIGNLSMSLDGFVAGPNDGPGNPMGDEPTGLENARMTEVLGVTHLHLRVVKED